MSASVKGLASQKRDGQSVPIGTECQSHGMACMTAPRNQRFLRHRTQSQMKAAGTRSNDKPITASRLLCSNCASPLYVTTSTFHLHLLIPECRHDLSSSLWLNFQLSSDKFDDIICRFVLCLPGSSKSYLPFMEITNC